MVTVRRTLFLLAFAGSAAAGCARDYVYRPTEELGGVANGYPTARYNVPPEAPRGDVTISSRGVVSVRSQKDADDEKQRMLHITLTASNDNDTGAWTLNTQNQRLSLLGHGERTPALAASSTGGAPAVTVAPGQRRSLDLYYALPETANSDDEIGKFELLWNVQTPTRLVAERTPFEREQVEDYGGYALAPVSFGYGARWWYDPFYYPGYLYPPIIYYDTVGPYYYPGTGYHSARDPALAPPSGMGPAPSVSPVPNISAPAPMPSAPPAMSAPPAPPVPSTPNISAPAR